MSPRGISSTILAELDSTLVSGIIYACRITLESGSYFWAERTITFDGDIYEPRIISVSDLPYVVSDSQQLSLVISNIDGLITQLDRDESWIGGKLEFIEYLAGLDLGYVRWTGWLDEPQEITPLQAEIAAYGGSPTSKISAPRRVISAQCPWAFASGSNYISSSESDGGECPYQRVSSIGFVLSLPSDINNSVTTIALTPSSGFATALDQLRLFDELKIDDEIFFVVGFDDPDIIVVRGFRKTTPTAHTAGTDNVLFVNCQFSTEACIRRGMFGNNDLDVNGYSGNRNYFGGFPIIQGALKGRFYDPQFDAHIDKTIKYGGAVSAYGRVLPLIYGRVRYLDPTLIIARPEGDFLLSLHAVCEGPLATNPDDDSQVTELDAYVVGTDSHENIFVNGSHRHDFTPGYGLSIANGCVDQLSPVSDLSDIDVFGTSLLSFNGTAWVLLRINITDNPIVDAASLSVTADFEIKYGRIVNVYSDSTTYVRKASTNPAWVLLDFECSKRAGGGFDYSRFDIDSFIALANYCDETISNSISGGSGVYADAKRWTFNGIIDSQGAFNAHEASICSSIYCLPPFPGIDGKLKIKPLRALTEDERTDIPLFTSISITAPNIIKEQNTGISTLRKKRKSILDIPNEIHVNCVVLDGANSNVDIQDHPTSNWLKTQVVVRDSEAQRQVGKILGDSSLRAIPKSVDCMGITTIDEAARLGTLILRAGEFARGGLVNNLEVTFDAFYKTSSNIELGDIIFVEDYLLDIETEHEFRVVEILDSPQQVSYEGGVVFVRHFTCTLHDDTIYDDTALTSTLISRYDPPLTHSCQETQATELDYGNILDPVGICYDYGNLSIDLGGI